MLLSALTTNKRRHKQVKSTKELQETLGSAGYVCLDRGDGISVHTYIQSQQVVRVTYVQFFV